MSKQLRYIGKPGIMRVNGRPMHPGQLVTDPQEVKDLSGYIGTHFEAVGGEPEAPAEPTEEDEG